MFWTSVRRQHYWNLKAEAKKSNLWNCTEIWPESKPSNFTHICRCTRKNNKHWKSLSGITMICVSMLLKNWKQMWGSNVQRRLIEKNPESLCLSQRPAELLFVWGTLKNRGGSVWGDDSWQFYKQILMLLPRGDCFPFHTAWYNYNLKWLVHIQFRTEHITEHYWQDALQLTLHRALWLHSFSLPGTLIADPSLSCSHC